jgi:hypothetical protein
LIVLPRRARVKGKQRSVPDKIRALAGDASLKLVA